MSATKFVLCAALAVALSAHAQGQPLLHYTFDEPSGDALDSGSAPLTDASLQGGASRSTDTPGGFGSSLDLRDDAANYAHALGGDADDLDNLPALTLTTWLKVEDYPSGNHRLSAKQAGGNFGGFSFNMNATPNDGTVGPDNFRLGLFLGNNVSSGAADFASAFSTVDVDATDWVFLAATYDSSLATDNVSFYIGSANTPVTQLGASASIVQITVEGGTSLFGIGYTDAAPTADTSVIGWQDDVRVYGSALSAVELDAVRLENIPEPTSLCLALLCGLMLARRRA